MERRVFKEIETELAKNGITVVGYKDGRKHGKMTITDGKTQVFLITHKTSVNYRALKNLVAAAKRTLAEHATQ